MKYIVSFSPDDPEEFEIEPDDPNYDGTVSNINDDIYTYHIDAPNEEEAVQAARWEYDIDHECYGGEDEEWDV